MYDKHSNNGKHHNRNTIYLMNVRKNPLSLTLPLYYLRLKIIYFKIMCWYEPAETGLLWV